MGTPEFAVPSLGSLLINDYNIVAVVTVPDKPAGRGLKMSRSAVAEYALENVLNLLQPDNLSDPSFVEQITKLRPDIIVVVAFRKLPQEIWKIPELGTFNLHASLLPQYRGAAPINHAIINGEKTTGLTTFLIDDNIDTGKILFRKKINIGTDDSAGNLHDKLMREGAKMVVKTVETLKRGNVKTLDQSKFIKENETLKRAPKIQSKDCYINWEMKSRDVYNFIRGLYPHPGARTIFRKGANDYTLKIGKCKCLNKYKHLKPCKIESDGRTYLRIGTGGCAIEIERLQMEGRKFMQVSEFLRGFDISGTSIIIGPPA